MSEVPLYQSTDFSEVDRLGIWYESVNSGARKSPDSPNGWDPIGLQKDGYRGTSLVRNSLPPLGPPHDPRYGPTVGSQEGIFLMSEVPLY